MIKRTFLRHLASSAFVIALPALAQDHRFELTAQAGPSLGWLRGNDTVDNADALFGAAGGLALQYDISERFGVRLGAGHQRKGSSVKLIFTDLNGNNIAEGDVRSKLDYLVVPLMFRASFGTGTRFTVGLGPYLGYLLDAERSSADPNLELPETDLMKELERVDLGLSAGVAVGWSLGDRTGLNAEVRYDTGLTDISALPVAGGGSIRTNAVCLLVGLSYRLGGAV